ncbi:MAG: AAA family ATPase [Muribaculaceae bacterium]
MDLFSLLTSLNVYDVIVRPSNVPVAAINKYVDVAACGLIKCIYLPASTDRLTITFTVDNPSNFSSKKRACNAKIRIQLTNHNDGDPIELATADFNVRIKATQKSVTRSVTMKIDRDYLGPNNDYCINIFADDQQVQHTFVQFLPSECIKLRPEEWFVPTGAYLNVNTDEYTNDLLFSPGNAAGGTLYVYFELKRNLPEEVERYPALYITLTDPDGKEYVSSCDFRPIGHAEGCYGCFDIEDLPAGMYDVKLELLGRTLARFFFSTKGKPIKGVWSREELAEAFNCSDDDRKAFLKRHAGPHNEQALIDEKAAAKPTLDTLIGLDDVKRRVESYTWMVRFAKMRRDAGLPTPEVSLHSMFLGAPGTGKTTVAKIIGQELYKAGVLSSGHVIVRERAELLGQFYNSEGENVRKAIEDAQGGILFIDEAYQLYQPNDPKDPGRFVIESLMTALADESKRDWMLILAGYTEPTLKLLELNPGLRSRIPANNIYVFQDLSEEELVQVAEQRLDKYHFSLTAEAREALAKRISVDYQHRDDNFGNARHIVNLIDQEILPAMAQRLATTDHTDRKLLSTILPSDIPMPHQAPAAQRPRLGFH